MSVRRLSAVGMAAALSLCFAVAQETFETGPIPNWTAPPYWTPPLARDVAAWKEQGLLPEGAEVVEGLPTSALPFFAIVPCRIVDTRPGSGFSGAYGPPAMAANASRDFDLNSAAHCPGIPAGAEAYSINVTVTETTGLGDIRMWPAGSPPAVFVSTQNWPTAGLSIANAAVVPAGTGGSITVFVAGSSTHLIIDINGYYAPISIVNTVNGISGAVTLAPGTNISITPSGGTLTIAATGGAAGWSLTGNAGTSPGTNFLGTTDDQRLEIKVNNQRVMRYEPNAVSPNVVGGFSGNAVSAGVTEATIAGGGHGGNAHLVTDNGGTIGGGELNRAGDGDANPLNNTHATVAGGSDNRASGAGSAVGGGQSNDVGGDYSTIAGGQLNLVSQSDFATVGGGESNIVTASWGTIAGGAGNFVFDQYGTVGGGQGNNAGDNAGTVADKQWATVGGGFGNGSLGSYSTIPGGRLNLASGAYGFAAGRRANAAHDGAFVWGDSTDAAVASTAANQFIVRASGGIWLGTTSAPSIPMTDFLNTSTGAHLTTTGIWTNNSDVATKENFEPVDREELLSRLAALPMSTWSYKADKGAIRHIGPMAQDFAAAFGVGNDDRSIGTLDADGVALAAIQGLYELVKERDSEIEALKERLSKLENTSK